MNILFSAHPNKFLNNNVNHLNVLFVDLDLVFLNYYKCNRIHNTYLL